MNADKVYDMCSLSYKYEPPPISYPKNKKPRICMCILGWVGNKKISVEEYSLVSIVIPSMMKTIQEQEKQRLFNLDEFKDLIFFIKKIDFSLNYFLELKLILFLMILKIQKDCSKLLNKMQRPIIWNFQLLFPDFH